MVFFRFLGEEHIWRAAIWALGYVPVNNWHAPSAGWMGSLCKYFAERTCTSFKSGNATTWRNECPRDMLCCRWSHAAAASSWFATYSWLHLYAWLL